MADSFDGSNHINIQPGDVNIPVHLKLNPTSASTRNDGSIPYGSSVQSVTFTAHHSESGLSATSAIFSSSSEAGPSGNTVVAYLEYDSTLPTGLYDLTAKVVFTISGSSLLATREYDLNRVYVTDR